MYNQEISIVLSGEAGQGLNTVESLFMNLMRASGYHAFLSREFMSRVRGGNNTTAIRVSKDRVNAFSDRIDLLIALSQDGADRLVSRISSATLLMGDHLPPEYAEKGYRVRPLNLEENLKDLGKGMYANTYIMGLLSGLFACDPHIVESSLRARFAPKGEDLVRNNLTAFQRGIALSERTELRISIPKHSERLPQKVLTGTDAIGIGAIAGGCNFIASYPMSPGTGVLVYLAEKSKEYGIIVEQAEDEIAAINMSLGAWYAGARGMVTTSGGGFALMTEGISLAGGIESPAVIHLAQRPGPATGLPTRTEQGDLNLALYAGHGDFPRIIYAPGSFEQGVFLTRKAFEAADQFQVPVILLTDQYFLDSAGTVDTIDFSQFKIENQWVKTDPEYRRYAYTPSGISPRGIPGFGEGCVCVDSDEHDEEGRITEDFAVRLAMVDKRMKKLEDYEDIEPELFGPPDYSILVVGWGSTCGVIREALSKIGRDDIAFAHFQQVWPVPESAKRLLFRARFRIAVENNKTGQFAQLLSSDTLLDFDLKILKYNGMNFSVEELIAEIKGGIA